MHLSRGCRTGVRPPGITATSTFRLSSNSLTPSVKWARKESQTRSPRCSGVNRRFFRIHSLVPLSWKWKILIRLQLNTWTSSVTKGAESEHAQNALAWNDWRQKQILNLAPMKLGKHSKKLSWPLFNTAKMIKETEQTFFIHPGLLVYRNLHFPRHLKS